MSPGFWQRQLRKVYKYCMCASVKWALLGVNGVGSPEWPSVD